ncbi:MAG: nucleotidyltransferase family protein, partial [Edaphobacter sp.]
MQLSPREWKRLLHWLDVSGLALYLLDRFLELGLLDTLPQSVVDELQQRMKDNAQRTRSMINESMVIQLGFQEAGLRYAVMKGTSLSPSSVPRPELRHQFD